MTISLHTYRIGKAGYLAAALTLMVGVAWALLAPAFAHGAAYLYTYETTASNVITHASGPSDPLSNPTAFAANIAGDVLYVLDSGNNRVVKYRISDHAYLGVITGFSNPQGIAFQPAFAKESARLYVADTGNNRILAIDPVNDTTRVVYTTGMNRPVSVAWSTINQRLYVLNRVGTTPTSSEVRIHSVKTTGPVKDQIKLTATFAGATATNSVISPTARSLSVQSDGTIAIADTGNNRVLHFSSTGIYVGQFGSGAVFNAPLSVGSRTDGYVPVVDSGRHRVVVYDSIAGGKVVAQWGYTDVAATSQSELTLLKSPTSGLSFTTTSGVIADSGLNRIMFFTVVPSADAPPRVPIDYDGITCTNCHNPDIRFEHEYRSKGCYSCHEVSLRTGRLDYTILVDRITADLAANGETALSTCGQNSGECHSAEAVHADGTSRSAHGMDAYQLQEPHIPRDVSGAPTTTNGCTGTTGGCHTDYSTESPFWFGSHDAATALEDYYYQQKRGTASSGSYEATSVADPIGTVNITSLPFSCMGCHAQAPLESFGAHQKQDAAANNEAWTCTTTGCHDGTSGVYMNPQCYRTPRWTEFVGGAGGMSMQSVGVEEPSAGGAPTVSQWISNLIDSVFGEADTAPAVTVLADPVDLPSSATPATSPMSLEEMFAEPSPLLAPQHQGF